MLTPSLLYNNARCGEKRTEERICCPIKTGRRLRESSIHSRNLRPRLFGQHGEARKNAMEPPPFLLFSTVCLASSTPHQPLFSLSLHLSNVIGFGYLMHRVRGVLSKFGKSCIREFISPLWPAFLSFLPIGVTEID